MQTDADYKAASERIRAHLAAHQVTRPDGTVVNPGDVIGTTDEGPVTFVSISRAPGDGSGTNGKILAEDPTWISPVRESYPSVYGLAVTRIPGAVSPYDSEA